jgi:hypothetical protein
LEQKTEQIKALASEAAAEDRQARIAHLVAGIKVQTSGGAS